MSESSTAGQTGPGTNPPPREAGAPSGGPASPGSRAGSAPSVGHKVVGVGGSIGKPMPLK